jgi:hypothetical protein
MKVSHNEMAPQVLQHPEARTTRGDLVIETSLARPAQEESPELVECFQHEGEGCPRCDGSGFRPLKYCAGCGEPAGSISQCTGAPLVKDRRTDGRFYHVHCLPGNSFLEVHCSCFEKLGD